MGCLKCGRDLEDGQVFCDRCLGTMARFPVKPGTPVLLPRQREEPAPRKGKLRLPPTPEAQLKRCKTWLRWGWALAAVFLTASLVLGIVLFTHLQTHRKLLPGQNYSTMETTAG